MQDLLVPAVLKEYKSGQLGKKKLTNFFFFMKEGEEKKTPKIKRIIFQRFIKRRQLIWLPSPDFFCYRIKKVFSCFDLIFIFFIDPKILLKYLDENGLQKASCHEYWITADLLMKLESKCWIFKKIRHGFLNFWMTRKWICFVHLESIVFKVSI